MGASAQAAIDEPVLLIRIPRLFRQGMSDVALYEATRAAWRIGPRRDAANLALAVADGSVREVYEIERWQRAGQSDYATRPTDDPGWSNRWEFVGKRASESIRNKYMNRSV